jgi:ribosomal 30S subunit maturation factor RimM
MPFKIIGSIVKPFGLKGNLLVKSEFITFNDFSSLKNLFIGQGETPEEVFEIESINIHDKFFNVKI